MSDHLSTAERDSLTDEQLARAIVAHAHRLGLSVSEWLDREVHALFTEALGEYTAAEGVEVEEEP